MSNKAASQKARIPVGCDENGPAAALLLSHVSIQICSFLTPVRLGPPCRRPILIATPLHQSLTWCTGISLHSDSVRTIGLGIRLLPNWRRRRTCSPYHCFARDAFTRNDHALLID